MRKYRACHEEHDSDNENVPRSNVEGEKSIFHFDTPLEIENRKVMILTVKSHDSRSRN